MKTIKFSLIMLAVTALAACSTPSNVIKGTIENSPFESWVVEQRSIADEKLACDTVALKAGSIKLDVADDMPSTIYFSPFTDLQT